MLKYNKLWEVSSEEEHLPYKQGVTGSSPVPPNLKYDKISFVGLYNFYGSFELVHSFW